MRWGSAQSEAKSVAKGCGSQPTQQKSVTAITVPKKLPHWVVEKFQ